MVYKMGLPAFPWEGVDKYDGPWEGKMVYKMGLPAFVGGCAQIRWALGGENGL